MAENQQIVEVKVVNQYRYTKEQRDLDVAAIRRKESVVIGLRVIEKIADLPKVEDDLTEPLKAKAKRVEKVEAPPKTIADSLDAADKDRIEE